MDITVRAQVPLLIRVWLLRRAIETESITPRDYRLSDNGVLFFNYGEDPEVCGKDSHYSLVISGFTDGAISYPMVNAMHQIQQRCTGYPATPVTSLQGSICGFNFVLKSERPFRVLEMAKWVDELYQLNAFTIQP